MLADERDDIELLVRSLANLSGDGLDLVSEHAVRLRTDIDIVTRLARSIDTNLDGIQDAVDGGRAIIGGFIGAYNPDLRAFDLRNSFGPLVTEALDPVFDAVGIPFPCVPVDVVCPGAGVGPLGAADAGVDRSRDPPHHADRRHPAACSVRRRRPFRRGPSAGSTGPQRSIWRAILGTFLGVGS